MVSIMMAQQFGWFLNKPVYRLETLKTRNRIRFHTIVVLPLLAKCDQKENKHETYEVYKISEKTKVYHELLRIVHKKVSILLKQNPQAAK